jgi:hypothetical protein
VLTIQLAALTAGVVDPHRTIPFGSFVFAIGLCGLSFSGSRFFGKFKRALAIPVLAGLAWTLIGCGGGFTAPPTTHPGSYVVTITGTSGAIQASTTVTVVVR